MHRTLILSAACFLLGACGSPDPADPCTTVSYWLDLDGDGFGSPATFASDCDVPANAVDNDDDCDDTSATVHPGVDDVCKGLMLDDIDLDGATDLLIGSPYDATSGSLGGAVYVFYGAGE